MVVIVLGSMLAGAQDFIFTTNNGSITITGYVGPDGPVVVPNSITSLPVTGIGAWAFYFNYRVSALTLPETLVSIGDAAFTGCWNLSTINIPNGVTNIGSSAFEGSGVTNFVIPGSVFNIGSNALLSCPSLGTITVDPTNAVYSSSDGILFDKARTTLISCPAGKTGNVIIPPSVTGVGHAAFAYCSGLTNISIPNSVSNIGEVAFARCLSLTEITVDGANAAYSSIDGVLFDKTQDTLLKCPAGKIGTYSVPETVRTIGYAAFDDCIGLTTIAIGTNVNFIDDYGFYLCLKLTAMYFRGNSCELGVSVFDYSGITNIYYLPETSGWNSTFGGIRTSLWQPHICTIDYNFGIRSNHFGFNIAWASGMSVVIEASPSLASPFWSALQTNRLTGDLLYFRDPQWTNYPSRFYRARWP